MALSLKYSLISNSNPPIKPFVSSFQLFSINGNRCVHYPLHHRLRSRNVLFSRRFPCLPEKSNAPEDGEQQEWSKIEACDESRGTLNFIAIPEPGSIVIGACVVGLLTGISVVFFNNAVHAIRDFFWDGIPFLGASWLREEPLEKIWQRVVLVPMCGGVMVGIVNGIKASIESDSEGQLSSTILQSMKPFLKATAAALTLGTGNSLGPEGPSVEIGASIAKGVGNYFQGNGRRGLSLVAAGSAAGISSGFNAAVAGCFFSVESVLWPSPEGSLSTLSNTTSMVILSSVIASVISEVGLGSIPAFTVPEYDFRSPTELPLYLLLGVLCGLVSLVLSKCTTYASATVMNIQEATGITASFFPILGGLFVGLIALAYPEILYWGFENVDILLESRPFVKGLSGDLLLQLVGAKIMATSLSRAFGLVGGYYAPSLFIGAATGMAYGKFLLYVISQFDPLSHLSFLEVASPQAYGLVGMAATLAGVCQVPLTSVLLLFELTQDYRIVLPLLGAVGVSSWISSQTIKVKEKQKTTLSEDSISLQYPVDSTLDSKFSTNSFRRPDLCELESSLCINDDDESDHLGEGILVSQVMRTNYVTVQINTLLTEAITFMLTEKQSCALIFNKDNLFIGLLTLDDIQEYIGRIREKFRGKLITTNLLVSDMVNLNIGKRHHVCTPSTMVAQAQKVMNRHGLNHLPVIEEKQNAVVGVLDRESISLGRRALAIQELLNVPTQ